jgi:WD40 repeat protein
MSSSFNPYSDWLQIGEEVTAPDHYQLLGLRRFEDDLQHIRDRYWERYELVRQYEVGAFSETAVQLLEELSQAFQCLSDPKAKSVYDDRLRDELEPTATHACVVETISDARPPRVEPLTAPVTTRPQGSPARPTQPVTSQTSQGPIPAFVLDRHAKAADHERQPSPAAAKGKDNRVLVIGGALAAVAVLVFCVAMLTLGLGSNGVQELASKDEAQEHAEPENSPAPKTNDNETAPLKTSPATGVVGEWTGMLEKVLAVREAPPANPGGGAVHLVIQIDDPKEGWSKIDAVVPDLAFLREIADYRSEQDGSPADRVVISGIATQELYQDKRVDDEEQLPVVELKSLRKIDGSAPALVGARRDLSLSTEAVDLAAAIRTLDEDVSFDALVGDQRDSTHFLVQVDALDRQAAVAWSGLNGLSSGQTLRTGQSLRVTAKVSGESARFDVAGSGPLEAAVLTSARVVLRPAPQDVARSGVSAAPSRVPNSSAPSTPATKTPSDYAPLQRIEVSYFGGARAVSWSPLGDSLATSGGIVHSEIKIWDGQTGAKRQDIAGKKTYSIDQFSWSPDGKWLVGMGGGTILGLWGIGTAAVPSANNDMEDEYSHVAWNRVTGHAVLERRGVLWLVLPPSSGRAFPGRWGLQFSTFDVSPDGTQVALAVETSPSRYEVVIAPFVDFLRGTFGKTSGAVRVELPASVDHLALRDDRLAATRRLAAFIDDQMLIYRIGNGDAVQEAVIDVSHDYRVGDYELSWSADGRRVAYIASDQVHVTEMPAAPDELSTSSMIGLRGNATSVAFAPDSVHLAIGQSGADLIIWSCDAKREVATLKAPGSTVGLDWRHDAQRLAALHSGGELTIWDMPAVPAFQTPAANPADAASKVDLLEMYARAGAWEVYHELFKTIDSDELTTDELVFYSGTRMYVRDAADKNLRLAADLKKQNPRWDNQKVIGQYQFLLKQVLAMDPDGTQAEKLLRDSIEESGELAYTPP